MDNIRHRQHTVVAPRWQQLGLTFEKALPIYAGLVKVEEEEPPEYDMHYAVEVGLILSGRMRRYYRGWQTDLEAGQVWYCGIAEPHGREILELPCEHLVLVMLPEALVDQNLLEIPQINLFAPFLAPPEQRPQASGKTRQELLAIARRYLADPPSSSLGYSVETRLLATEMLLLLQQDWAPPQGQLPHSSADYDVVGRAVALCLEKHGRVTTREAAATCDLGSSTFHRAFQRLMGLTYTKFTLRYRLGQVAYQLLITDNTISSIARDWGFTDDSHLHRCFVRHYHCSPGTYRERPKLVARVVRGA